MAIPLWKGGPAAQWRRLANRTTNPFQTHRELDDQQGVTHEPVCANGSSVPGGVGGYRRERSCPGELVEPAAGATAAAGGPAGCRPAGRGRTPMAARPPA